MATTDTNQEIFQWYVMRDLKRPNAKLPAYKMLKEMGLEVFTPMVRKTITRKGEKIYSEKPFIPDLLFIRNSRKNLDPIVNNTTTLQYRFLSDGKRTPMTVNSKEMELFIKAAKEVNNLRYCAYNKQHDRQTCTHCRRSVGWIRRKSAKITRFQKQTPFYRTTQCANSFGGSGVRIHTTVRKIK